MTNAIQIRTSKLRCIFLKHLNTVQHVYNFIPVSLQTAITHALVLWLTFCMSFSSTVCATLSAPPDILFSVQHKLSYINTLNLYIN
jgi:hypothetical protein